MNTVLLTGCSSGYGRAAALHFLEQGWNVVATMRAPDRADLPSSERLRISRLDVTEEASIVAAVRDAVAAFGSLDVVVNNAGIGLLSAFEATPDAIVREIFETNTFGVMAVCRTVVPLFRERRAGLVVNVTSSVGIVPMPLASLYSASKLAIEGFTESLAYELSFFGVAAKIVEPGYGPSTRFTVNGSGRMEGLLPESYTPYLDHIMKNLAAAKTTTEADVARAVFLAATDGTSRLRYPAGADADDLAAMRRALPGDAYLDQMRSILGPPAT